MKILSEDPPRIITTYITHVDLQGICTDLYRYIWSENSSPKDEAKMADIEELSWLHFFLRLRPNDERS